LAALLTNNIQEVTEPLKSSCLAEDEESSYMDVRTSSNKALPLLVQMEKISCEQTII
jgi:hypothetical protein